MWEEGWFVVAMPKSCIDSLCEVFIWQNIAAMGAFSQGFLPFYYSQDVDGSWISGPTLSIGGVSFGAGEGSNGNDLPETLVTVAGYAYIPLHEIPEETQSPSSIRQDQRALGDTDGMASVWGKILESEESLGEFFFLAPEHESNTVELTILDDSVFETDPPNQWTIFLDFPEPYSSGEWRVLIFICPA